MIDIRVADLYCIYFISRAVAAEKVRYFSNLHKTGDVFRAGNFADIAQCTIKSLMRVAND